MVGLAGIAGSILAARLSINAEDKRAHNDAKRRIYAAYNAAIEDLWITATSSEDFTIDPGRSHYNQAMKLLSSSNYEVSLIAPEDVSELTQDLTDALIKYAYNLRTKRSDREPSKFDEKRKRLVDLMRDELSNTKRPKHK